MTLWVCRGCSARYAVGSPRCPQCAGTDAHEEGDVMAKIGRHMGASNAAEALPAPPVEVGEVPCPGTNSSPSETKPETKPELSAPKLPRRARKTASPSSKGPEEPGTADSVGDGTPAE